MRNLRNMRTLEKGSGFIPWNPSKLDSVLSWYEVQYTSALGDLEALDKIGANTYPQREGALYDMSVVSSSLVVSASSGDIEIGRAHVRTPVTS